jgi:mannose-6-phosphate isomerase
MFLLSNAIRDYAWGTTGDLAEFVGRTPSGGPEAELWIGAHHGAPSLLPGGRALDEAIREDPLAMLGARVRDAFGDRLPFLMKVLAVNEALSLQVHPSTEQARAGFAREDGRGVAVDAPTRSYPDPWHKPELVVALSRFDGVAGFRDVGRTAGILRLLSLPWADEVAGRLLNGPPELALRSVVTDTLALSGPALSELVGDVGAAARRSSVKDGSEPGCVFAMLDDLAGRYPHDPGVLVTALLNYVVLQPGEALFVDAGVVHAYGAGFALEIMASSDNVLRAGLTGKHMDVGELLAITDFAPTMPPRRAPVVPGAEPVQLAPPVEEFALVIGRAPLDDLPESGPRVVLVLDGEVQLATRSGRVRARRGESVFVPHGDGPLQVHGAGRVAVGSVP